MAHGDQFTATGPAFNGSGFPRSAFSTNRAGADFVHGVNVEGLNCGVFGKCVKRGSRDPGVDGVGVYGKGDNFGVLGQGNVGPSGVIGTHTNNLRPSRDGAGLIGAVIRGGTGVIGISLTVTSLNSLTLLDKIPNSADGGGVGVFGASGTGPGVRGASQDGTGGQFTSKSGSGVTGDSTSGEGLVGNSNFGTGVIGTSNWGTGVIGNATRGGVGVEGRSAAGAGLHGVSGRDRGAVFESGNNVAQIRLVPKKQNTKFVKLPGRGKVGDLAPIRK